MRNIRKRSNKDRAIQILIHCLLLTLAVITLIPFIYIIMMAFGKDVVGTAAAIPEEYTFDNFARLFAETSFLDWIRNSIIISLVTMVISVIFVSVSVYVFSRLKFLGKHKLFNFILLIQVFPLMLSMVSIFRIFVTLGLLNDIKGLIIINATVSSAGLVLLAKGYFDTIPYELDEAAMMDGATKFQTLIHIILPLAKPMLAVVAIQSFVIAYNEYAIASTIMTQGLDSMPLAVGLQSMIVGQYGTNWSLYCAASVLGSVPMILLFYSMQKYFIGGLTEGSVKM
ncbi:MAG: ABC transporter permease subunit [Candidatus Izemoplasmatales bacterium]|jgi:arabinogalactan oligomer/maltooligosaccharide transport system permease protein|nr:ABC transporter permease subunit [Candidatus Izemoplasmatales bacterium]MDD3865638.1 ABC transporter permease subunit [Candidatus Izemoplasmatales bacterium]